MFDDASSNIVYRPGLGSNLVPILPFAGESVHQGVYAVVGGPQFESAAEVRMLRMFGADIVGKYHY